MAPDPAAAQSSTTSSSQQPYQNMSIKHINGLQSIRNFLHEKSSYDILPESYRLIVFDSNLTIKRALAALIANGVVSAPLYDSSSFKFAGMFTLTDIIHLIQYYYLTTTYESAAIDVEGVSLASLRDIEETIDVPPPPTYSLHPDKNLYDACASLVKTHARRLPLIDFDDSTGKETILSVLTQYRVLKFLAINCAHECNRLVDSIGFLGIGTYISSFQPRSGSRATKRAHAASVSSGSTRARSKSVASTSHDPSTASTTPSESVPPLPTATTTASSSSSSTTTTTNTANTSAENSPAPSLTIPAAPTTATTTSSSSSSTTTTTTEPPYPTSNPFFPLATATLQTTVFDIVHQFSELGISAVPIVDDEGKVINLYETVDVVDLVRQNAYQALGLTVKDALARRSKDFPGVVTCTPDDSLASILGYIREKRVHRFVVVEDDNSSHGEDEQEPAEPTTTTASSSSSSSKKPTKKRPRARLVGIVSLSDILRHIVAAENLAGQRWNNDDDDDEGDDEQQQTTTAESISKQQS